jgi:hypothetical protein
MISKMYIKRIQWYTIFISLILCQSVLCKAESQSEIDEITTKLNETQSKFVDTDSPTKGHILFFHNAGSRSHLIAMSALAQGLLDHGYIVTTVFFANSNIEHENYNEILIEDR